MVGGGCTRACLLQYLMSHGSICPFIAHARLMSTWPPATAQPAPPTREGCEGVAAVCRRGRGQTPPSPPPYCTHECSHQHWALAHASRSQPRSHPDPTCIGCWPIPIPKTSPHVHWVLDHHRYPGPYPGPPSPHLGAGPPRSLPRPQPALTCIGSWPITGIPVPTRAPHKPHLHWVLAHVSRRGVHGWWLAREALLLHPPGGAHHGRPHHLGASGGAHLHAHWGGALLHASRRTLAWTLHTGGLLPGRPLLGLLPCWALLGVLLLPGRPLLQPRRPLLLLPWRPLLLLLQPRWPLLLLPWLALMRVLPGRPLLQSRWPLMLLPRRSLLHLPRWPLLLPRWPLLLPHLPRRSLLHLPRWPLLHLPRWPLLHLPRWPMLHLPRRPLLLPHLPRRPLLHLPWLPHVVLMLPRWPLQLVQVLPHLPRGPLLLLL